jgi:hypothetical protein
MVCGEVNVPKATLVASAPAEESIDLKDPFIAAVLAWLIPGLGHLYQRRTAKGVLFMVCILSTYFFGLFCSDGHAVYASWTADDQRLYYFAQVGVGAPALPALLQNYLVRNGKAPLWGGVMAPPVTAQERNDWYRQLNRYLELGTVYTTIVGLLNLLVIYDAWAGPMPPAEDDRKKKKQPDDADEPPPPSG